MSELLTFFVVISASLLFSELFKRLRLPWVVSLVMAGIIIGPYVLGFFTPGPAMDLLGQIGLVFLMFMAGLHIRPSSLKDGSGIAILSLTNGLLPMAAGIGLALFFGYGVLAAALLGIIFMSSSIAVVIPSLESSGLIERKIGKSIIAATMVEDAMSLILFSVLLQAVSPTSSIPLVIFYPIVFAVLFIIRKAIPQVRKLFTAIGKDDFEQDFRLLLAILMATVVLFEFIGLHAIIAGFFAGFALSGSIRSEALKEKLHALSYGVFIPMFFVIIGTETDISVFWRGGDAALLAAAVVLVSVISKFASGWIGGKLAGFSSPESTLFGVSTIPQLSTTLAVAFTGLELGVLDHRLITAMIFLSMVTTLAGPAMMGKLAKAVKNHNSHAR